MKIGDLVRYREVEGTTYHNDWLGIIIREVPGTNKVKVVEWVHKNKGRDRGSYRARDLELASANR